MNRKIFNFFILVVTIFFLYLVLKKIDWSLFFNSLIKLNLLLYTIGLFCVFFGLFLQTFRWSLCFTRNNDITYTNLLNQTAISYFFNQFFLAFIGGDIYRTISISEKISKRKAVFSIIITRITNIWGAALIPLPSYLFFKSFFKQHHSLRLIVYLSCLAWILFIVLFFIYVLARKQISCRVYKFIPQKWQDLREILNLKSSVLLFVTSLLFQFIAIFSHYFYARALGIGLNFIELSIAIPAILFVTSLPISVNGIGVRESSFVITLGFFGIGAERAFAMSLLSYSGSIILGLMGGILYVIKRLKKDIEPFEQHQRY